VKYIELGVKKVVLIKVIFKRRKKVINVVLKSEMNQFF